MTYTEIVILTVLMGRDMHGYDIKKIAENLFGESRTINNNTLYTCLHKYEEMGAVIRKVEHVDGKPDRHVYSITDKGREVFREMLLDFTPDMASSRYEFYSRVAFFHLLEPQECLNILSLRKADLTGYIDRLRKLYGDHAGEKNHYYDGEVVRFITKQERHEIEWIEALEAKLAKKEE